MGELDHAFRTNDSGLAGLPVTGKRVIDLRAQLDDGWVTAIADPIDIGIHAAPLAVADSSMADLLGSIREIFLLRVGTNDNWYEYVERLAPWMPHWSLLPDQGRGRMIAFGHDAGAVALAAVGRGEALSLDHPAVRLIDLATSGRTAQPMGNSPATQLLFADLRQQLAWLPNGRHRESLAALRFVLPLLSLACRAAPADEVDFGTDHYWLQFFKGLASFIETGQVTPDNPYVHFVRELSTRGAYDPGMCYVLADPSRAVERLRPRLAAFWSGLTQRSMPGPLILYNPIGVPALEAAGCEMTDYTCDRHVTTTAGRSYRFACLDGNHRLSALWLGGARRCPIVPIWTNVVGRDPLLDEIAVGEEARMRLFDATARELLDVRQVGAPGPLGSASYSRRRSTAS